MDFFETLNFLACSVAAVIFFYRWYSFIYKSRLPARSKKIKYVFAFLPLASLFIIYYTLVGLASFDVVGDMFWTLYYVVMGYAWIYACLIIMSLCFDLSWIDDGLNCGNLAAAAAIAGGVTGVTIIYSGANIGDGPGWWCVLFAGALGTAAWVILGGVVNIAAKIFGQITVGRDFNCGVRTGCYFLAGGIILARASAGDWTSFKATAIEFMDGWPVLILTIAAIAAELYCDSKINTQPRYHSYSKSGAAAAEAATNNTLKISIIIGVIFILFAVLSVILLPPLPTNSIFREMIR